MQMQNWRNFDGLLCETILRNLSASKTHGVLSDGTVSIENGLSFARAISGATSSPGGPLPLPAKVVDGMGHARSIYPGLLVYSWLQGAELENCGWQDRMRQWCAALALELKPTGNVAQAEHVWDALALSVAADQFGNDDWHTLAANTFGRLASQQQIDGSFLPPMPGSNPEARWYDELVLLHAMSSYSVQARDPRCEAAAHRAAEFHLLETQPDHATQQPWAIFAFCSIPAGRIQAEQILHGCAMRTSRRLDAVSLILLADAVWCIRNAR
jgi:hypothetical protein